MIVWRRLRKSAIDLSISVIIHSFPGKEWTDDEHAEIRRLEKFCSEADQWDLECSHSDDGDPWCIVYDQCRHWVFLHIARIDRQYVVVWGEQGAAKTAMIAEAIDIALEKLRPYRQRAQTSTAAIELLRSVERVPGNPWVFPSPATGQPCCREYHPAGPCRRHHHRRRRLRRHCRRESLPGCRRRSKTDSPLHLGRSLRPGTPDPRPH